MTDKELYDAANEYAFNLDGGDMNTNRDSFIAGAEWMKEQMIDKACEFINQLCDGFSIKDNIMGLSYTKKELLKDFRKAMEE